MSTSISARGLVKVYHTRGGPVRALDGVDLDVPGGTVLGLLGPNGAGKTTAVRVLTTLLTPDAGTATVAGFDVSGQPDQVRRHIGLSGQNAAVDEYLTGRENLALIGRLYHLGRKAARQRADDLLERFDLTEAANRTLKGYSGGMRRRLDLAGALVARPPVLFLDEPTTGLDPRSRIGLWDVISDLVGDGTTLLLTTQYLEEADKLADKIAVVDHGRVIARGTSDELKARVGGDQLEVTFDDTADLQSATEILAGLTADPPRVDQHTRAVTIQVGGDRATGEAGVQTLIRAIRELGDAGIIPLDIGIHRPTLDDVFLSLTGQRTAPDGTEEIA